MKNGRMNNEGKMYFGHVTLVSDDDEIVTRCL